MTSGSAVPFPPIAVRIPGNVFLLDRVEFALALAVELALELVLVVVSGFVEEGAGGSMVPVALLCGCF